jgi:CRISPR-associated protein Csb2
MPAIAWQYLSGQVTAKECTGFRAEWPPHPDRVFQSLVAAWGERGCDREEKNALEWLEAQESPHLAVPDESWVSRALLNAFVPTNDKTSKTRDELHDRKVRSFATVSVGDAVCALIWPGSEFPPEHHPALERLCANVTHVGHSRSMVRMWISKEPPPALWIPIEPGKPRHLSLRVPHSGRLAELIHAYADGGPDWKRPPLAPYVGYIREKDDNPSLPCGDFDDRLIILRKIGGDSNPSLQQAPAFVSAIRSTLLSYADSLAKPLVSGHQTDGHPLMQPHVNWLPLAFVGSEHADGHLMGMGIAFPREITPDEEQSVLNALADAFDPDSETLTLRAGKVGSMILSEADRPGLPLALRPDTWTRQASWWGTTTPIVLDRLPPRRHRDHDQWAREQICVACGRQGLPCPEEVHILPVSPFKGAPTCRAFPPLKRRKDGVNRWHVHARIRFPQPVVGPLLLGAGRYRGYGFCKPLPFTLDDSEPTNRPTINNGINDQERT